MFKDPTPRQIEQALKSLEGRFDKRTAHLRAYQKDIRDIDFLLSKGVIDSADATIYKEQAEAKRDAISAELIAKEKKLAEPPVIETVEDKGTNSLYSDPAMAAWAANRKSKGSLVGLLFSSVNKPQRTSHKRFR